MTTRRIVCICEHDGVRRQLERGLIRRAMDSGDGEVLRARCIRIRHVEYHLTMGIEHTYGVRWDEVWVLGIDTELVWRAHEVAAFNRAKFVHATRVTWPGDPKASGEFEEVYRGGTDDSQHGAGGDAIASTDRDSGGADEAGRQLGIPPGAVTH